MAVLQPIIDLVQICRLHGVTRAVISPGSRSAALILAFARNPGIECAVVADERAAGFIALGMAQQLRVPVALVCTSGSAAYNFAPAVAEAFFQQVPLIVFTADRPIEWIHQNDGQTIYQREIYGKHVKGFWELPADYAHPDAAWFINRSANEALIAATTFPHGPVHVNVPIREPFYPEKIEKYLPGQDIRIISRTKARSELDEKTWQEIEVGWEGCDRVLLAVGQHPPDENLGNIIRRLSEKFMVPVVAEVISNQPDFKHKITFHDLFLDKENLETLRPDLLITVGQSFLSKQFKQFVRKCPPKNHWHISEDLHIIDTFQSLTRHIPVSPEYFLIRLSEIFTTDEGGQNGDLEKSKSYLSAWLKEEHLTKRLLRYFLGNLTTLDDITAVNFALSHLPARTQLHLANSMSVRYANLTRVESQEVEVYCNRGTSGIDGCVSTAIGAAMISERPVFLIVGDVTFFYDRNGLLIDDLPTNLRIVLINNGGGNIFRLIDGPSAQPELETYFEAKHNHNALRTAEDSGITYFLVQEGIGSGLEKLGSVWNNFLNAKKTALIEVQTNPENNKDVFRDMKKFVKKRE